MFFSKNTTQELVLIPHKMSHDVTKESSRLTVILLEMYTVSHWQ